MILSKMVGPDRLELSTSVLSGPRSNHLSYGPTMSELYRLYAKLDKGLNGCGVIDLDGVGAIRLAKRM